MSYMRRMQFVWGAQKEVAWEKVVKAKAEGGLGITDNEQLQLATSDVDTYKEGSK